MVEFEIDDLGFSSEPKRSVNIIDYAQEQLLQAGQDADARTNVLNDVCQLLANETNIIRRSENIKQIAKLFEHTSAKIERFVKDILADRNALPDADQPLPQWVNRDKLYEDGFIQLFKPERRYPVGIYFNAEEAGIRQLTNFTIRPVIHIQDRENNRRIVEVSNGKRTAQIEMPSRAFVAKDMFETSLIERGNFITKSGFEKNNFKRVISWLSEEMPMCWEIKTLGWQPEQFFAFSNCVWHKGNLIQYSSLGLVEINDTQFISLANSSINSDTRDFDNPYEHDKYLSHIKSKLTFAEWSALFAKVYGNSNAINGIAYVFISIFKDVITRETKCPLLFSYGSKGSGKSDYAESILHIFFSGKNSEGKLMAGINLNPGQITRFAFFNLLKRFANCPILLNEFDESRIEDWVFGSIKSFYDGEGKQVGDGSTGKALKTREDKPRGTMLVVGQYLSTGDDGSVLSRAIVCQFDLSRMEALSDDTRQHHKQLKEAEEAGLSSIIVEILNFRKYFSENFKAKYWLTYNELREELLKKGIRPETRLLRNYALLPTIFYLMEEKLTFPITGKEAFDHSAAAVSAHFKLLKETNALAKFWKIIEGIFDRKLINWDQATAKPVTTEFTVRTTSQVRLKRDGEEFWHTVRCNKVLTMRFSSIYGVFAKEWRAQTGNRPPDEATLVKYLQDQPYYIGLDPKHFFHNKNTSGYVFNYDILSEEINLEYEVVPNYNQAPNEPKNEKPENDSNLPF